VIRPAARIGRSSGATASSIAERRRDAASAARKRSAANRSWLSAVVVKRMRPISREPVPAWKARRTPAASENGGYPPKLSGSGMSLVARNAPEGSVVRTHEAAARWSPGDTSMEAFG
jgi:hypothetical protein